MSEKICYKSKKGPAALGPYSSAVIHDGLIWVSGVIGVVPATGKPAEGGTLGQAAQIFKNIETILGELDAGMDDVLKTTIFLTNMGDFGEVNKLYAEAFGPNYPARSCVEVSKLPGGYLIEIECVARAAR